MPEAETLPVTTLRSIRVLTTLPALPISASARAPIRTARLTLRPWESSDLAAFHALKSEPGAQRCTQRGIRPYPLDEARSDLAFKTDEEKAAGLWEVAVCLRGDAGEELIGTGGSHMRTSDLGWPCTGYIIAERFWGQGIATEELRGFLEGWWGLERRDEILDVDEDAVVWEHEARQDKGGDEPRRAREMIMAVIEPTNIGSRRVLEKVGFKLYKVYEQKNQRPGQDGNLTLYCYGMLRPGTQ